LVTSFVDILRSNKGPIIKRSLLVLLFAGVCQAFGGPVHVSIDAQGIGSGLIRQAYTTCLLNTPGVKVVAFGEPTDALIQITSIIAKSQSGVIGYAWANATIDPLTKVQLDGPVVVTTGKGYQEVLDQAATSVRELDTHVLSSLRNQPNN
jgi:hypothetical protein